MPVAPSPHPRATDGPHRRRQSLQGPTPGLAGMLIAGSAEALGLLQADVGSKEGTGSQGHRPRQLAGLGPSAQTAHGNASP